MAECVKVIVRCRPMNSRELNLKCKSVVVLDIERGSCSIMNPDDSSAPPKTFSFDGVYCMNSTTERIYNESVYPLIEGVLEGYNGTVFAYGQTGCGKSFSMQGVSDPPPQRGIIPRSFEHIFEAISVASDIKYLVLASYLEIYNEEIRDLLGLDIKKKLDLKECPDRGVYVQDLTWHAVGSVAECEDLMSKGWSNRSTGATLMNADSSRSHSIFSISIEMMTTKSEEIEGLLRKGKLSLVDLAGSERQMKTGAIGDRLKEASKINLSLSALGNVISALVDGKAKHIPYRDSKLTRLLQDSLGGNTKTLMLACLSPADNNYDETLSTLRYANRAKNICNKPHINEDPKDAMLRKYQEEIENLKSMLTTPKISAVVDEVLLQQEREKVRQEYERELSALRSQFSEMHTSKIKVQSEFETLKIQYENQIKKIDSKSVYKQEPITIVDGGTECKEERDSIETEINRQNNNTESKLSQQEVLARLVKLQRILVGGEKAGDVGLKEQRARRKRAAEKKLNALAEILAKEENNSLVLGMYDDMHEQLTARSETLKKYRHKIKSLEREITDLQSEFEVERTDYLETIRRLDRQVELNNQILEKIIPTLKNQYNYSNIEAIKSEALWDDDLHRWILPDLISTRTKLPPAVTEDGLFTNDIGLPWRLPSQTAPGRLQASLDSSINRLSQKFDRNEEEDFAGNYFKPKRAMELLTKAQQDVARANNFMYGNNGIGINLQGSLNAINTLSSFKTHSKSSFLNNSWSGPPSSLNGWIGPFVGPVPGRREEKSHSPARKPVRLEALPLVDRKTSTKPQLNTLDVI